MLVIQSTSQYIHFMRSTSASDFRKNLTAELDKVLESREPLIVHRYGKKAPVVVVPLEDFEGMDATDYLMSNPANRERLLKSMAEADAGKFAKKLTLPE